MASIVDFFDKLERQNYGPKDSKLISTINNPGKGAKLLAEWLRDNVNTASSMYAPSYQQGEAANNLAGLAQLGSFPMVPKSAGGTLGTLIKYGAPDTEYSKAHEIARRNAVEMLGLPENNTAMDRAKALGFDVDAYHGTGSIFDESQTDGKAKTRGAGAFFSSDTVIPETYAPGIGSDANIIPVKLKASNLLDVNAKGRNWNDINTNDLAHNRKKLTKLFPEDLQPNDVTSTDEIAGLAPYFGFEGASIKNVKDVGPNSHIFRAKEYLNKKYGIPISESETYWDNVTGDQFAEARNYLEKFYQKKSDVYSIQNPSNIRSRFAAFDPAKKDSANLLASLLLPASALGYGMMPEQENASLTKWFKQ